MRLHRTELPQTLATTSASRPSRSSDVNPDRPVLTSSPGVNRGRSARLSPARAQPNPTEQHSSPRRDPDADRPWVYLHEVEGLLTTRNTVALAPKTPSQKPDDAGGHSLDRLVAPNRRPWTGQAAPRAG